MFTHDLPASKIAALSDVSRSTINQRFFKLRPGIAQLCDASSPFPGEVEGDEPSFGTRRVRGKKGRGGGGKKQSSSEIVSDASQKPLQPVIWGQGSL